jgi:cell division protein FtsW
LLLITLPVAAVFAISAPYRLRRITGYLHVSEHKDNIGYQAYQALIGLGNGGIFGVGLGEGGQKYFYLPEPHTDFVFSILGEEIGFVGLLAVLAIFGFIIYRGMKIAYNAPDKMGQLMAFGFSFILGMYVIVHACVNTGIIPTTGIPLPFLSYGGMSLVFTMSSMGLLLNISSQSGALHGALGKREF